MYGNFAVFDEWTEIYDLWEGEFMEKIARGAFANTFANDRQDMRVLFQHGRDGQLGSKALGTIESLEETKDGAAYESQLFRGLPELLLEGLAHDQYGASFRFETVSDEWDYKPKASAYNPRALPERTLTELRVAEFGPVTFPAYKTASAALRSLTHSFMERTGRPRAGSTGGGLDLSRVRVIPGISEVQAELQARDRDLRLMGVIK
jgi:HK97 family phage prohead protease